MLAAVVMLCYSITTVAFVEEIVMYSLPEPNHRQRQILKINYRIEHFVRELRQKNKDLEDLLAFAFRYGYANIAMGNVPLEFKEQARNLIKLAHEICQAEGYDSQAMFAPEIANTLLEISAKRCDRILRPYRRARQKIIQTALKAEVSALKSEVVLIGDQFVYTLKHNYFRGLLFTPKDKEFLASLKDRIINDVIRSAQNLTNTRWLRGDESSQSTIKGFLEDAELATWIAIEEVRVRYYASSALRPGAIVMCSETPQKGDDTRMLDVRVGLYFGFEQSPEDGEPTARLDYFLVSETMIN